jgi:tRNA pseudouridine55 synthase
MVEGLLVVDKPEGPTSFDVVARLRRALATREVGHTGTLDPLARGVVVVLVGRYTKLASVLTDHDKRYVARVEFGASTTTDDREGDVVAEADASVVDALEEGAVRAALPAFVGALDQVPPAYAAIKVNGEKLYEKARRGEVVTPAPRKVVVHGLELLGWEVETARGDDGRARRTALIGVHCGKGTYVRALARDLGRAVGVPAHLGGLLRTVSGAWTLADAVALEAVTPASPPRLRVGREALRGLDIVDVDEQAARALGQGRRVRVTATPDVREGVAVACLGEALVALVRCAPHPDGTDLTVVRGLAPSR